MLSVILCAKQHTLLLSSDHEYDILQELKEVLLLQSN